MCSVVHPLDGLASEASEASEARKTMKSRPELRCNMHPLDGLASESRKTMKSLEATFDVGGNVFGRESAVRRKTAASELRLIRLSLSEKIHPLLLTCTQMRGDTMNYTVYCRLTWPKKCIISVMCVFDNAR